MNAKNNTIKYYLKICKFQVVVLITLVSAISMILASPRGSFPAIRTFILGNLGIFLVSISGGILNHLIDEGTDAVMERTKNRPLVLGEISRMKALIIACFSLILGSTILVLAINVETMILAVTAFFGYAGIYTLVLKKLTSQNIVIGGLSGAMPPALGWCAVRGNLDPKSLLLVLILFSWTPPHFWSLALSRIEDYKKARIPMMPVVYGVDFTKLHILLYSVIMIISTYFPYLCELFGVAYVVPVTILNAVFMYHALSVYCKRAPESYMRMFKYSIVYLAFLFISMLTDHFIKRSMF